MSEDLLSEKVRLALIADNPDQYILQIVATQSQSVRCPTIGDGRTVIVSYKLAHQILLDNHNFSSELVADNTLANTPPRLAEKMKLMKEWPLYSDTEKHLKIRKLMLAIFNKTLIDNLRPKILLNIEGIVKDLMRSDETDILKSIAEPLPLKTFCHLIGIDDLYSTELKILTSNLQLMTEPDLDEDAIITIEAAWDKLYAFFDRIISEKKYQSGYFIESLISADMDKFEITNHCVSILFGAHETTSSLIANAIHQLLSNPDQLSLLEQDESLIPSAVEEVLRFDPPAKLTARVCLHDIRVGDIDFSNQEKIMIYFNCINRDPAIYTDPHQFLITRKEKRHISFGYGVHACFGAALAKMQAEVVLVKLIPLLKNKKIKSLSWIESMVFRKMDEFVIVEQEARHT